MADFDKKTLDDWRARAAGDLKDRGADDLAWQTPEGLTVKPLYTAADLEALEAPGSAILRPCACSEGRTAWCAGEA